MGILGRVARYALLFSFLLLFLICIYSHRALAQGITASTILGSVSGETGQPLSGAGIFVLHRPSGTLYRGLTTEEGRFMVGNIRPGGPYTIAVILKGYRAQRTTVQHIGLGQNLYLNFKMINRSRNGESEEVAFETPDIAGNWQSISTSALGSDGINTLPSVQHSSEDLFRISPFSDGNLSFSGQSWFYNNLSVDGSYFDNLFGLDDPVLGGQSNVQPLPFDALSQIYLAISPFEVTQGGFTGANINAVTKAGGDQFRGSLYSFTQNESLIGKPKGSALAHRSQSRNLTGLTASGPIQKHRLFFFFNAETEQHQVPGSDFVASRPGLSGDFVSRVDAQTMADIRQRMIASYLYDPGPFENYRLQTGAKKLLVKMSWNADERNTLHFRYNFLDAKRDLPPDPFSISPNTTGRGPNANSLPFRNAGFAINNEMHSIAAELNTQYGRYNNRFLVGYNSIKNYRTPFSRPFPTIEIVVNDTTYTTLGHEPFSIENRVDQSIWQMSETFKMLHGPNVLTFGANLDVFNFTDKFNLFNYGRFFLPAQSGGTLFTSLEDFFRATNPDSSAFRDFNAEIDQLILDPFQSQDLTVGQFGFYFQNDYAVNDRFRFNAGLRIDFPFYSADVPDNRLSQSLTLLDSERNLEKIKASDLPAVKALYAPRFGFVWNVDGHKATQLSGGTGLFSGRFPFVWIGNILYNQGPDAQFPSLHINAVDPDFKWPQVWNTRIAIEQRLPADFLGTAGIVYGKNVNAIVMRNADLVTPVRTLPIDGRPYFGGPGSNKLNPDFGGGVFVLDNKSDGHFFNFTAQFSKQFITGLHTFLSYNLLDASGPLDLPETAVDTQLLSQMGARASLLWEQNPIQGDPNNPRSGFSEFGNQHRFSLAATFSRHWSGSFATHIGLFAQLAKGARSTATVRSRFSYTYLGDVNGDGSAINDLIYIPRSPAEINFAPITDGAGTVISTAEQQWDAFNAFIEQDDYLRKHRGKIAERNAGIHPWFSSIDLRVLQDFALHIKEQKHTFQLSLDILNLGNLLNSSWGVRKTVAPNARTPLLFTEQFTADGAPILQFPTAVPSTFIDDTSMNSRWQAQVGLRYLFN